MTLVFWGEEVGGGKLGMRVTCRAWDIYIYIIIYIISI